MKLWALILAAGAILAFAAPVAADAAASPAGNGGSARTVNSITRNGPQTTVVFRDLMPGEHSFFRQFDDGFHPVDAQLAPNPSAWQLWLTSRWAWAWLL